MNLLNITKHLVYLTQTEYGYEHSAITTDEICASKQLFQVLKSFKDSYFSEIYTYDTLELADQYDELTDDEETDDEYDETTDQEEDSDGEADDYNENEHYDIKNHFTLEEMENIIEWVDEHPNARFTNISHRFRKIKSMKQANPLSILLKKKMVYHRDGTINSLLELDRIEKSAA
ncbi:unnamed protein product [Rotaria sordida]|uniref:Uncharacterized protein n=1 Tax=Rotaria sordida TaxID=392033 RepID=A0A814MEV2_9BILA|nr:unnamed protein product [Rotaria sordida]CAF1264462.1 unnamed protein product [Rotaria sordida]